MTININTKRENDQISKTNTHQVIETFETNEQCAQYRWVIYI